MVGVAVGAVGAEGHHHLRLDTPDVRGDRLDRFADVNSIQRLVLIVEHRDVGHPQHRGRRAKFPLADLSQSLGARVLGRLAMPPESALLSPGGRDEKRLDALGRVLRQGAADTQRLVVWVGQHGHQAKGRGRHAR